MKLNLLTIVIMLLVGCNSLQEQTIHGPTPPPPITVAEAIARLDEGNHEAKLGAITFLHGVGEEAAAAVPSLIDNLTNDRQPWQVSASAARLLGAIGPRAGEAVPHLVAVLHSDAIVHVREAAAEALGAIGDRSAVPDLISTLHNDNEDDRVLISVSLGLEEVTGEDFGGKVNGGFYIDELTGLPIIALNAREWWEQEGQYQEWPSSEWTEE